MLLVTLHVLLANVLVNRVFAQTPTPEATPTAAAASQDYMHQNIVEINQTLSTCKDENSISGECHTQFIVDQMAAAGACQLGGFPCGAGNIEEQQTYIQRSLLGQTAKYTGYLFIPPATTGEYLAYTLNKAGLIPKAYAQGLTYSRMLPTLPLWKVFRDISYMLLTLVMLAIGVIIAFRAKINPQTVASAENTIPNIIVTLLLITLSFPIATLIIDFMYVMIAAGIRIIGPAIPGETVEHIQNNVNSLTTGGPFILLDKMVFQPLAPISEQVGWQGALGTLLGTVVGGATMAVFPPAVLLPFLGSFIGSWIHTGEADLFAALSPIFIILIFLVLFFAFFRIFFMLLSAYIQILMFIIFGPIILLLNALPGNNTFSYWWKNIAGNMLAFVITAILVYLGYGVMKIAVETEGFWAPPFIGLRNSGAFVSRMSSGLIALGILLGIPTFVKMVKEKLGAKPFAQAGPSIIFAPITGAVSQGLSLSGQFYTAGHGFGVIEQLLAKFGIGGKGQK